MPSTPTNAWTLEGVRDFRGFEFTCILRCFVLTSAGDGQSDGCGGALKNDRKDRRSDLVTQVSSEARRKPLGRVVSSVFGGCCGGGIGKGLTVAGNGSVIGTPDGPPIPRKERTPEED